MELTWELKRALPKAAIFVSQDIEELVKCQCMLLYLNSNTWTRGIASSKLAEEVTMAMERDIPRILAHEFPSWVDEHMHSPPRDACPFGDFFVDTPLELIKAGLYKQVATALKPGRWRKAALIHLAGKFGLREKLSKPAFEKDSTFDKAGMMQGETRSSLPSFRMSSALSSYFKPLQAVIYPSAKVGVLAHSEELAAVETQVEHQHTQVQSAAPVSSNP